VTLELPLPAAGSVEVEVDERRVTLSTLERPVWREPPFTKRDLLTYYARVAPVLLPHVAGRPLTVVRFPEGIDAYGWYQTQCRGPAWMRRVRVAGRTGKSQDYCVVDGLSGLLSLVNAGAIELHPLLARADALDRPTAVVFDLDPGEEATFADCCRVALELRGALDLPSFAKASGALGLHVHAPVEDSSFEQTKRLARDVAEQLAEADPQRVTAHPSRARRAGRVFVDWMQNDRVRSVVAPYSLRALAAPTVAQPLDWDEVEYAAASDSALVFGPAEALERVRA
jgi:bifunctional non-homologous end joining protein LigD